MLPGQGPGRILSPAPFRPTPFYEDEPHDEFSSTPCFQILVNNFDGGGGPRLDKSKCGLSMPGATSASGTLNPHLVFSSRGPPPPFQIFTTGYRGLSQKSGLAKFPAPPAMSADKNFGRTTKSRPQRTSRRRLVTRLVVRAPTVTGGTRRPSIFGSPGPTCTRVLGIPGSHPQKSLAPQGADGPHPGPSWNRRFCFDRKSKCDRGCRDSEPTCGL